MATISIKKEHWILAAFIEHILQIMNNEATAASAPSASTLGKTETVSLFKLLNNLDNELEIIEREEQKRDSSNELRDKDSETNPEPEFKIDVTSPTENRVNELRNNKDLQNKIGKKATDFLLSKSREQLQSIDQALVHNQQLTSDPLFIKTVNSVLLQINETRRPNDIDLNQRVNLVKDLNLSFASLKNNHGKIITPSSIKRASRSLADAKEFLEGQLDNEFEISLPNPTKISNETPTPFKTSPKNNPIQNELDELKADNVPNTLQEQSSPMSPTPVNITQTNIIENTITPKLTLNPHNNAN